MEQFVKSAKIIANLDAGTYITGHDDGFTTLLPGMQI